MRVLIASSNPGKLRDFAAVASLHNVEVALMPDFSSYPEAVEDGSSFDENARKKAEHYSRFLPGTLVLADDSGLEVDALGGAPGVFSARYAALGPEVFGNSPDDANNARLIRELAPIPEAQRTGRFVCVIAIARNGQTLATFRGAAEGLIRSELRGTGGFGYDPLFYFPGLRKTFAELSPPEKAVVSHRGMAFAAFLDWCDHQGLVRSS
ncbi:MAG TPA: RdgB/HAM1 family non-canonical purine NTP pyrophosphatase [Clostridia bacterium]|nr:RdgB/HAM1 family non-canonical purine NTP pyrophosphatase [Clostridia bacterium]